MVADETIPKRRVGTALYQYLQSLAAKPQSMPPEQDYSDQALACAERHGYAVERYRFESVLDLAAFDGARFRCVVEQVKADGVRFFNLAQEGGEAVERRLYLLRMKTAQDIPGYGRGVSPSFDEWRRKTLENPTRRCDCIIVAAIGDRLAGLLEMIPMGGSDAFYVAYTGVDREFRGRRIAQALTLLAVQTARRYGARRIWTNNDSHNAPMLALNRKLGFAPAPGLFVIRRKD